MLVVVQSLSRVQLFATPWMAAHQVSLSFTISQSLPRLMSIEWIMPSNHLVLCCPLLLLPSVFPSIRVLNLNTGGASGKEPTFLCRRQKRLELDPWVGKIPWRRAWQSTPISLPGESHGQRSLAGLQSMGLQRVGHD